MKKRYSGLIMLAVSIMLCTHSYAATLFLQPNASEGKDTFVYTSSPNINYSSYQDLYIWDNYSSGTIYTLIEFDISSLPANQMITSAIMELNVHSGSASTVNAYKATSHWDETGATWNTQPTIDLSTPISASSTIGWIAWDITSFVTDWYTGTSSNYGIELRNMTSGVDHRFYSSDSTATSLHPKLTITYAEQTLVPEPATMILLTISGLGLFIKRIRK